MPRHLRHGRQAGEILPPLRKRHRPSLARRNLPPFGQVYVRQRRGGVSANDLTVCVVEGPSGNALLNGVAVSVEAA